MTQSGGAAIDLERETKRPALGNDREKRGARRADCGPSVDDAELAPHSVEFPQYDWRLSTRQHHYTYLTGRTSPRHSDAQHRLQDRPGFDCPEMHWSW
jgi:hypothetical protein